MTMAQKLSMLFSFAAFLVAWIFGLAAHVPPDAILWRSIIGATAFYLAGMALCHLSGALLDFPTDDVADESEDEPNQTEIFSQDQPSETIS